MASAKEYFQMKKEELQDDNYDKKLVDHRRKRLIIIGVVVLIILLACITFAVLNINKTYHSFDILNEIKRDDDTSTVYLEYQNKFHLLHNFRTNLYKNYKYILLYLNILQSCNLNISCNYLN